MTKWSIDLYLKAGDWIFALAFLAFAIAFGTAIVALHVALYG